LAKVTKCEVFVFLGHTSPRLPTVKFCFFIIFDQGYQQWKFVFSWPFLAKDTNGKSSWFFLVIFGQDYPWWKLLFFLGHFWPRLPMVKVFVFSWSFLAKITFIGHLGYEHQWWKLYLWFEVCFWATSSIPLCQTHLAMNTNDESYICHLRFAFEQPLASRSAKLAWLWIPMMSYICHLRFAFEQTLASRSAKREFAFTGGNLWHPTVQGVHAPGGNCWDGTESTSLCIYRQASVGKKYDFTRTMEWNMLITQTTAEKHYSAIFLQAT